jgi:hypothetical protein
MAAKLNFVGPQIGADYPDRAELLASLSRAMGFVFGPAIPLFPEEEEDAEVGGKICRMLGLTLNELRAAMVGRAGPTLNRLDTEVEAKVCRSLGITAEQLRAARLAGKGG